MIETSQGLSGRPKRVALAPNPKNGPCWYAKLVANDSTSATGTGGSNVTRTWSAERDWTLAGWPSDSSFARSASVRSETAGGATPGACATLGRRGSPHPVATARPKDASTRNGDGRWEVIGKLDFPTNRGSLGRSPKHGCRPSRGRGNSVLQRWQAAERVDLVRRGIVRRLGAP